MVKMKTYLWNENGIIHLTPCNKLSQSWASWNKQCLPFAMVSGNKLFRLVSLKSIRHSSKLDGGRIPSSWLEQHTEQKLQNISPYWDSVSGRFQWERVPPPTAPLLPWNRCQPRDPLIPSLVRESLSKQPVTLRSCIEKGTRNRKALCVKSSFSNFRRDLGPPYLRGTLNKECWGYISERGGYTLHWSTPKRWRCAGRCVSHLLMREQYPL